jgi:hypothetical protein
MKYRLHEYMQLIFEIFLDMMNFTALQALNTGDC